MKKTVLVILLLLLIGILYFFGTKNMENNATTDNFTDSIPPLIFKKENVGKQWPFISIPAQKLKAKLIPNMLQRKKRGIESFSNTIGVTHFFLDHDLTTGFVHPFTQNFYNMLPAEGFVMKFDRESDEEGWVHYVQKKDLKSTDVLGKDFAFMRQWKLSDLAITSANKATLKPCNFNITCGCVQVSNKKNPYNTEFPIANYGFREGTFSLEELNEIGTYSGGTIVIIWENEKGEIWFQDVHSSLNDIINEALKIKKLYNVDPTIAIGDAGPYAQKIRSNEQNILLSKDIDGIMNDGELFGAGFGYVPQ